MNYNFILIRLLIILLQLLPLTLFSQANLVLNGSLEFWKDGQPINWKIEKNTVDIFFTDLKIIPSGVKETDEQFRSRFPSKGSDGKRYFGVASNEVISFKLSDNLSSEHDYQLSFYVYNPPIYSDKSTNKFTVNIPDASGKGNIKVLKTQNNIDTTIQKWIKVSATFKGFDSGNKIYCGFFGDVFDDLEYGKTGLYYLFDEIELVKLDTYNTVKVIGHKDSITLNFDKGVYLVDDKQLSILNDFKAALNGQITKIVVNGYASTMGAEKENMELSQKRTREIYQQIHTWSDNIELNHYGESKSIDGHEDKDRKVEIIIDYKRAKM